MEWIVTAGYYNPTTPGGYTVDTQLGKAKRQEIFYCLSVTFLLLSKGLSFFFFGT